MNPVISAVLIVGGVGLVCSLLLVVANHFFRVEEEELTKKIRECLPGANCGACGFTGCDLYAKEVALGNVAPNLCIPGSVATAKRLSELLGLEVTAKELTVAFVKCHGNCDATTKQAICDNIYTCRSAMALYGGPNACITGCLGFGDCSRVCPSNAICIEDGIAHINPKLCIGCGMCVKECPKHIIVLYSRKSLHTVMCSSHDKGADARVNCKKACIACKKCEKTCPENAIVVVNNLAVVDYDKCSGCGKCIEACPTGCIQRVDFSVPIGVYNVQ